MLELPLAVADALRDISRHSAVQRVHGVFAREGRIYASVDMAVNLPSRAVSGISATGVRAQEEVLFRFPPEFPAAGPFLFLRDDFPSELPHINPHKQGTLVPPCVYQGSLNDLLLTAGIESVIDQLASWLDRAASGQLLDFAQGWEPTRRGDSKAL